MMVIAALVYLLIGAIFGITFFAVGYRKIDPSSAGTPWHVRLLWTPAALAIWPILIVKWLRAPALQQN